MLKFSVGYVCGVAMMIMAWVVSPYAATLWHIIAIRIAMPDLEAIVALRCQMQTERAYDELDLILNDMKWRVRQAEERITQWPEEWRDIPMTLLSAQDYRLRIQEEKVKACSSPPPAVTEE